MQRNHSKIVGFLITKKETVPAIDFFSVGLKLIKINSGIFTVFLWGIGELKLCTTQKGFSLAFPVNDTLLDRNILVSITDDEIFVDNDWLGSIPVFYNKKEVTVSTLPNLCVQDKTIHKEGLANFCEFGYSVFEQTIFEDVKFMRYFSQLVITQNAISIKYKEDPVLNGNFLRSSVSEEGVIDLMQNYVSDIEQKTEGDIVLPTSGGFDSRLLNYLVKDKSRIRSYTYGISKNQEDSYEVVHAKKISEIYNTRWKHIKLESFHKYIDSWHRVYGFSTHLHGMYHIEFYKKIFQSDKLKSPSFFSGIIGDAWAEYGKFNKINHSRDLINLGYTHGMCFEKKHLLFKNFFSTRQVFFDELQEFLSEDRIISVFAMRTKLMLISYLTQIPEYFGLAVWTPFLNFEIVKSTLNITDERRRNRVWQRDFFRSVELSLEDMNLKSVKSNKLDYELARNADFEALDVGVLAKYINTNRLLEINKSLSRLSLFELVKNELLYVPKIGGVMRRLGFKNEFLKALYEYYVLKAIEKGLTL